MRCENKIEGMRFNRFLSGPKAMILIISAIDVGLFLLFNYIINVGMNIGAWINDKEHPEKYIGIREILPKISEYESAVQYLYIILAIVLIILDIYLIYKIRVSFSEIDINKGQEGTSRWTTIEELKKQCKAIPLTKETYVGAAGMIMAQIKDTTYVNVNPVNRMYIGSTRSGKDQMFVLPEIDANSRAEKMKNRPSMMIQDPKLSVYKSCKKTLEKRGYIVRLFNLFDPMRSMRYNYIQLVINNYKKGFKDRAEMAAKSFSFSIFHTDENIRQEPIWKDTATDLFTALIVAVTSDCLYEDEILNKERSIIFKEKQDKFFNLEKDDQENARKIYYSYKDIADKNEDVFLLDNIEFIPSEEEFYEINPNEKKANCFSVINFFKELCDRAASESDSEEEFEKNARTALDEYFNNRPKFDFAASLYSTAKTAGSRTRGSIYTNMQSATSNFLLHSVAQMISESDIDIADIAYGDKPYAIFIATPFDDMSNHFLATAFISQVSQYMSQLATMSNGVLKRKIRWILNECGNLPPINNLAEYITVGLEIGMYYELFFQSYNQLYEKYKNDAKTIKDNCNHIYIMSNGEDSSKEFSEAIGNKTIISTERNGSRLSINKTYFERPKSKPLIFPKELRELKPGEFVINRTMQRTDTKGATIKETPIIAEYKDKLSLLIYAKTLFELLYKRLIKKECMVHPDEEYILSFKDELEVRIDDKKRYYGTALLYAYQYLTDDFPNAKDIDFNDICDESYEPIGFEDITYDVEKVLKKIKITNKKGAANENKEILFKESTNFLKVKHDLIKELGADYKEKLNINENDSISKICQAISANKELTSESRTQIIAELMKGGVLNDG